MNLRVTYRDAFGDMTDIVTSHWHQGEAASLKLLAEKIARDGMWRPSILGEPEYFIPPSQIVFVLVEE